MIQTNENSNLYIQNFDGQAPGIYKIIHGFDESILQQAFVMQTLTEILHALNSLITNFSNKMKNDDIVSAKTYFVSSMLSTLITVATIAVAGSFVFYSNPIKMAQPTMLQKFHKLIGSLGQKAALQMMMIVYEIKAMCDLKKGKFSSNSIKIQSANSQLTPLVDVSGKTMDSCSQTIIAETKSIKRILEYDYSSKAKSLYFYKL